MNNINFKTSNKDNKIILDIVDHAQQLGNEDGYTIDHLSLKMDITAAHLNGCRLRLQDLLEADNFNFSHDVFGIAHHINRETGKLDNHFLPRFSY